MNDLIFWVASALIILVLLFGFLRRLRRRSIVYRHKMIFAPSQEEVDQLTFDGWELVEMLETGEYHFRKVDL